MEARADEPPGLDADTREFYCRALNTLRKAQRSFLVGGAYAFERYTGIARHTKDLDIFVREADRYAVLQTFADAGYHTELTFPHWLGKAFCSGAFVDVIFGSGNGIAWASLDGPGATRAGGGAVSLPEFVPRTGPVGPATTEWDMFRYRPRVACGTLQAAAGGTGDSTTNDCGCRIESEAE